MKKAITVGLLFCTSISQAAWFENNPDHTPSVGFMISAENSDGEGTVTAIPISATQDISAESKAFVADMRLPMSDNVTFIAAFGLVNFESEAMETSVLTGSSSDVSGYSFALGTRFYFGSRSHPTAPAQSKANPPPAKEWKTLEDTLSNDELIEEMKSRGLIPR